MLEVEDSYLTVFNTKGKKGESVYVLLVLETVKFKKVTF